MKQTLSLVMTIHLPCQKLTFLLLYSSDWPGASTLTKEMGGEVCWWLHYFQNFPSWTQLCENAKQNSGGRVTDSKLECKTKTKA